MLDQQPAREPCFTEVQQCKMMLVGGGWWCPPAGPRLKSVCATKRHLGPVCTGNKTVSCNSAPATSTCPVSPRAQSPPTEVRCDTRGQNGRKVSPLLLGKSFQLRRLKELEKCFLHLGCTFELFRAERSEEVKEERIELQFPDYQRY